eukprot:6565684-Alexandrium_andersonii.AAC.1
MSASLVGSEMCIRDRTLSLLKPHATPTSHTWQHYAIHAHARMYTDAHMRAKELVSKHVSVHESADD